MGEPQDCTDTLRRPTGGALQPFSSPPQNTAARYFPRPRRVFTTEMQETIPLATNEPPPTEDPSGRADRLDDLYARHAPAGMRLAFLLTGDRNQAEDLMQEAFVRCLRTVPPPAYPRHVRCVLAPVHREPAHERPAPQTRRTDVARASRGGVGRRRRVRDHDPGYRRARGSLARPRRASVPPASRTRTPLLRRPVRTTDGGNTRLHRRRRQVPGRARVRDLARASCVRTR